MKCDLCKRETRNKLLCDTCAEAVKRAIEASRRNEEQQSAQPKTGRVARAAAA